jgi:hypothetical protein
VQAPLDPAVAGVDREHFHAPASLSISATDKHR